jgi:RNA polymerase sigma-70 factor, ECF subfamily
MGLIMATSVCDQSTAAIPALTAFARSLTHNRSKADDLVQDWLERALTK